MSLICFVIAAVLAFLLGLHIVEPSKDYDFGMIVLGFIALGLALGGVPIPNVFRKD